MEISFNDLPGVVSKIYMKLETLEALLKQKSAPTEDADTILTIEECAKFLKLAIPTIYGLVSRQEIPCMKKGKRLYFSKQGITNWLQSGKKNTAVETAAEVDKFLAKK